MKTTIFFLLTLGFLGMGSPGKLEATTTWESVIAKETDAILQTQATDYDMLAQLHMLRGESHIFNHNFPEALLDLEKAYSYLDRCRDEHTILATAFYTSFCLVVVYDHLDMPEECENATRALHAILEDCASCPCSDEERICTTPHYGDFIQRCDNYADIIGPETASPEWCAQTVENTVKEMRAMAESAKSYQQRNLLKGIVDHLRGEALKCCRKKRFWKECLAPLAREWKAWKEHQAIFGQLPMMP